MSQGRGNLDSLIAAARLGSREALGDILESYRPFLEAKVRQYMDTALSVKFGDSAIVQEALLAAVRDFPKFRGHTGPEVRRWLESILVHRVHDLSKQLHAYKRNVAREVPLSPQLMDMLEERALEDTWEGGERQQEQSRALRRSFGRLPPTYQRVIYLRGKEQKAFGEVADDMHRSVASVKKLWLRALQRWRKDAHAIYREPP